MLARGLAAWLVLAGELMGKVGVRLLGWGGGGGGGLSEVLG